MLGFVGVSAEKKIKDDLSNRVNVSGFADPRGGIRIELFGCSPFSCIGKDRIHPVSRYILYTVEVNKLYQLGNRIIGSVLQDKDIFRFQIKAEITRVVVLAHSFRYRQAKFHILRQSEGIKLVKRCSVIAGNVNKSRAVCFKNAAHWRSLIVQAGYLPDLVLCLARRKKTGLAAFKIILGLGSVFFQDTLRHKVPPTARGKVGDRIRAAAELFQHRVLSAVGAEDASVVKHGTDLLSPVMIHERRGRL